MTISPAPHGDHSPLDHGARLIIDLGALADNWRLLNRQAAPGACGAVVKANAYGIGIEQAVPALVKAGCRTFYVAHFSEAKRVRSVERDAALYVLNGLTEGLAPRLVALNARPVLGSMAEVMEWRAFRKANADAPPAALHVDTGMNRLGLRVEEALGLERSDLGLTMLLTHFVSSEMPDDPINEKQRQQFEKLHRAMPDLPACLANSAGHFHSNHPQYPHFRGGYALYGGNPTPGHPNPMRPVVRLDAPIVQIRQVPAGETVGYNSRWTARRDSLIATVSVGYADGYPRNASSSDAKTGGMGRVGGILCPIAGGVSMDLITLDVTDVPSGLIARGKTIALIDEVLTVDRVGEAAGTIGYEILTRLGARYVRHYIGG